MKKKKQCLTCKRWFGHTPNDRPNSWEKRKFCSSKCSNARPNKGQYANGHKGILNSGNFKKGLVPWNWKGDKVGYDALHRWVSSKLGKPDTCKQCKRSGLKAQQIHWSNISGEYKRILSDWQRLCAKCHKQYDLWLERKK